MTPSTQLGGYSGDGGFIRNSSGVITYAGDIGIGPGVPVAYDAQRGGFTYLARGFASPGMPALDSVPLQLNPSLSDQSFAVYTGSSSGVSLAVKQLRIGNSNPTLPLLYTSIAYGTTEWLDPNSGDTHFGVVPFAFGISFPYDTATIAGQAAYDGNVLGNARAMGGTNSYDISGRIHIDVNYDTTEYSGFLEVNGRDTRTGDMVTFSRVNIQPYPPRRTLDSLLGALDGRGSFQANFAGPQAQELMGGFDMRLADPREPSSLMYFSGTFAAKK